MASPLTRARAVPWALALSAAVVARDHWGSIAERDRSRIVALVRASRGRPGNLTRREREELIALAKQIDVLGIGRDIALSSRGRRGRRKR
jgi:hypothetical protein